MILLNRFIRIVIALSLFATSALAQEQELQTVILEGNLYGRSSVDFRANAKNVTSLIPQGTTGTVLETRKLKRTGSYGVKIRINKVSRDMGSTTAKENDEVWVYYSQKDPWLSFQDKAGSDIQDPEEALTSRAKRDGLGLPAEGTVKDPTLPTKQEIQRREALREAEAAKAQAEREAARLRDAAKKEDPNLPMNTDKTQTEAGFSATCTTCTSNSPATDKNVKDITDVSTAISERSPAKNSNNIWADDPYISAYSNNPKTEKMIRMARKAKAPRSKRLCYRYVKNALLNGDILNSYPPSGKAKEAVKDLKAQGMVNLMDNPKYRDKIKSPQDAPKGAVLVYSTGESKEAGHIEIKTDNGSTGTYVSDYESAKNIQQTVKGLYKSRIGKPYKIIGVMIMPPEKL